ncbi:hypothetical protein GQ54DRAFT_202893 [Martensiomyces pterosporus]|nr:hypothetical protein GQ54DRAFT_202893 [Martensiomyces pterosporus]
MPAVAVPAGWLLAPTTPLAQTSAPQVPNRALCGRKGSVRFDTALASKKALEKEKKKGQRKDHRKRLKSGLSGACGMRTSTQEQQVAVTYDKR